MEPESVLLFDREGGDSDAPGEAATFTSVASVLHRNDLVVVVLDSLLMPRSAMLALDRLRIERPATGWLVLDTGLPGVDRRYYTKAKPEAASDLVQDTGCATRAPQIRTPLEAIAVTLHAGMTKQFALADYTSRAGTQAEVLASLHGKACGHYRATEAVDEAMAHVPDLSGEADGNQGMLTGVALPLGGNLAEFTMALERIHAHLPARSMLADFVGKESPEGLEVALILTRAID